MLHSFFARDLALGDEVETDANYIFKKVLRQSGQFTFRVWFGDQDASTRSDMINQIKALNPFMEWSSENLLALSVSEEEAQKFANQLEKWDQQGLIRYETGRS